MFTRILQSQLQEMFFQGKIIILTGPRQIGKTTLMETILSTFPNKKILSFFGEHLATQGLFSSLDFSRFRETFDGVDIIFIDEGQKITNIGDALKILIDTYKSTKQVIVTGSSSFHLLDEVSESLAGRKRVFQLFPISFSELVQSRGFHEVDTQKEQLLLYGMYPKVLGVSSVEEKIEELRDLASSALFKDILEFQSLKNPQILTKLLQILALQIGHEVSLSSLGQELGMDGRTIERYIDLLEKSYIIFRLPPLFTNKKKEITKMQKIYFYDVGIRNSILGNFISMKGRSDVGQLWENWIIAERRKYLSYTRSLAQAHFWRGSNQQEVDYVEHFADTYDGFEMKWKPRKTAIPSLFHELYPTATYDTIHQGNYFEILRMSDKK